MVQVLELVKVELFAFLHESFLYLKHSVIHTALKNKGAVWEA